MEFDEIEPGMVFEQTIGGEYGTKFWIVYGKNEKYFSAVVLRTRIASGLQQVTTTKITSSVFNSPDYEWTDRVPVDISIFYKRKKHLIYKHRKRLIMGLFED